MFTFSVFPRIIAFGVVTSLLALGACKKDDDEPTPAVTTHNFTLELEHRGANGRTFKLDTVYTNAAGSRYALKTLKYYLSNVQFTRQDGTIWQEPNSYHLVTVGGATADNPQITVKDLPLGTYTKVTFAIGVDPIANTRTDQVGDLSPTNEMAWNWSTGYKFLLLEGQQVLGAAPATTDPAITMHLGTAPTYRPVTLTLPTAGTVTAKISPQAHLEVDVNKIFGGPNVILFGATDFVVMGGNAVAQQIADNYATMFTAEHVHNEPDHH